MKKQPLVSVIMPAYNSELYIAEAIRSILSQTYSNLELIIVNDASTDNTLNIIRSFSDSRIHLILNSENMGVSASLNKAIDAAKGYYIARMDADDKALPKRLETQVHFLERYKHIGVCGTFAKEYGGTRSFTHVTSNEMIRVSLLFQNTFVHPTVMFQAVILKQHKYSEKFNFCEDYELWSRLSSFTQFANIPQFLLSYRVYEGSVSFVKREAMDALRRKVVEQQLYRLEIRPTEREMYLHLRLANVYNLKDELFSDNSFLTDLRSWILFLQDINRGKHVYISSDFYSVFIFRYILACHFLKNYSPLKCQALWKYLSFKSAVQLMQLFYRKIIFK